VWNFFIGTTNGSLPIVWTVTLIHHFDLLLGMAAIPHHATLLSAKSWAASRAVQPCSAGGRRAPRRHWHSSSARGGGTTQRCCQRSRGPQAAQCSRRSAAVSEVVVVKTSSHKSSREPLTAGRWPLAAGPLAVTLTDSDSQLSDSALDSGRPQPGPARPLVAQTNRDDVSEQSALSTEQ
jgi:hypothetical protein